MAYCNKCNQELSKNEKLRYYRAVLLSGLAMGGFIGASLMVSAMYIGLFWGLLR